ncbi:PREDICTED: neuronal acetylcholine receptor subunit alpha-10-like [Branchiostoma belcheri]|uniref:Neuronal acetylcholine receptor subunit alpha-10-like n=1 Tax=Branchiostoma belcheri TaxID=7741 RepID=A0A6P5A848_BRABE|nr:PREDICTED: neuronal acetylcholine receptor subunit alpha-10-like [Branchiostoma belcheri]
MTLAWSVIFLVVLHVQLMACSLVNANLRQDILRKYDKNVRPVRNFSRPTEVRMDVSLRQILGLAEREQVLTSLLWIRMYWTDEYLSWDPDQYDELDVIRIPSGDIWLPDIFLYNNADVWQTGELATNTDVSVTSDGDVTWLQPITARTSCKVHTGLFPFDNQVCDLLLGSWSYDGTEIDLYNTSESGDISSFVVNGEWDLLTVKAQRELNYYSCCPEPWPNLRYLVALQRRADYYLFTFVLPCMASIFVVLGGFFLPTNAAVRIQLNVTVLLALTVFLMMVQESMPTSSGDVSVIGEIYTTAIAIVGLSTLATVLVINLSENDRPVPAWIARYFSDNPPKKVGDHGGSHGDHHAQAQSNGYDNEACGHVTHDVVM